MLADNKDLTPFRIVIFSIFPPAIEIANRLGKHGVPVLLILSSSSKLRIHEIDASVKVLYFGKGGIRNPLRVLLELVNFQPDAVHLWCSGGLFAAVLLPVVEFYCKLTNCPRVSTVMEPTPRPGMELTFSRRFRPVGLAELRYEIESASHVITTNLALRQILEGFYGLCPQRIDIIPHLEWDAPEFEKWKRSDVVEEKWILFFGTVAENKGLEYLIASEPLITSRIPNAKIVIAGAGQKSYHHLIKNRDNFILYDRYIDFEEAAFLFQKSAIVVLPYTFATMSGIIGVAYMFERPVVASNVGGFPEFIDNLRTGILVPPREPAAIAKAAVSLLENDHLRKEMGKNAFRKLTSEFSWDVYSGRLITIYRSVCKTYRKYT